MSRFHLLLLAAALLAAPLGLAPSAAADVCPAGQEPDGYLAEQCVFEGSADSFSGMDTWSVHVGGPNYGAGGVPSVNGIPCTPEHYGTCIGMGYNQVPYRQPQSTISHSP